MDVRQATCAGYNSFVRVRSAALVSALLLVPVAWLPLVSIADLQSHVYNAWLVQLVHRGEAQGLYLAPQLTNVLVDALLAPLFALGGAGFAERTVAALVVLVFFWGAYSFVRAAHEAPAAPTLPWLAIGAYGYVFQLGLLNFALATGLVLAALALLWTPSPLRRVAGVLLLGLALLGHPIPVLWGVGLLAWRVSARYVPAAAQIVLLGLGVGAVVALHAWLPRHYDTNFNPDQPAWITGADQAVIFGPHDLPVAGAFVLVALLLLARRENRASALTNPLSPWLVLTAAAIALLPTDVRRAPTDAWAGLLAQRLSLFSFVLVLGILRGGRRLQLVAGVCAAVFFFGALRLDLRRAVRLEAELSALVRQLPRGARVIANLGQLGDEGPRFNRVPPTHLLSRACLGHCFDYMNYEASTGQFRLRARPGNAFVTASITDAYAMEHGLYVRKATDPPLWLVYHCGPRLCLHSLQPGESANSIR